MENILIEEEATHTKEINGEIRLYYKPKYSGQNILNDITFKTWLNEQEKLKGKNKLLFKCWTCKYITYIKNEEEIESINCCERPRSNYDFICPYCGDYFLYFFYCCKRISLKWQFATIFLNGRYFDKEEPMDVIKLIPFMFHIGFVYIFFEAFFFEQKCS